MIIGYFNELSKLLDSTLYCTLHCYSIVLTLSTMCTACCEYCLTALGSHSMVEMYVCRCLVLPMFDAKRHQYTLAIYVRYLL